MARGIKSKFPQREPIERALFPLGFTIMEIADVIGCSYATVMSDLRTHLSDMRVISYSSTAKRAKAYQACFRAWMDRAKVKRTEAVAKIERAIEERLELTELKAFAYGLASSMEALTTPVYPREFAPFAEILWSTHQQMSMPTSGDELLYEFTSSVRDGRREAPASALEVRLALMKIHAHDPRRLEILTPFPEYMLEVCEQALSELELNHNPHEAQVLKLTTGIGCQKQTYIQIARDMGLSHTRIRQINLCARSHFGRLVHAESASTSVRELTESCARLEEWLVSVEAMCDGLNGQMEQIAKLVDNSSSADLLEAVGNAMGCVLSPNLCRRVDELELSVRAANCLQNAGVEYIWQILEYSEADLLRVKNFGRKSLNEIKVILAELDPSLKLGTRFSAGVKTMLPGITLTS